MAGCFDSVSGIPPSRSPSPIPTRATRTTRLSRIFFLYSWLYSRRGRMFEGGWGFLLLSEAERLNKAFRVREEGGEGRESRHFGPMPRAFNERSLRRLKKRGEVEISPSHAINVGGRFLNSPTKITLSLSLSLEGGRTCKKCKAEISIDLFAAPPSRPILEYP